MTGGIIKFTFLFLLLLPVTTLFSQGHPFDLERMNNMDLTANQTAPELFYETNGLVCMEAEHARFVKGWKLVSGETGKSMQADKSGLGTGVLAFRIRFKHTGDYAVWLLGRKDIRQSHHRGNRVLVVGDRSGTSVSTLHFNGKPTFVDHGPNSDISFGGNYISRWFSGPEAENTPKYWNIEKPGNHRLELLIHQEYGFTIDRIVLTLNNEQPPRGLGPAETVAAQTEQPQPGLDENVILPPAWAFGVIYGNYAKQDSVLADVKRFVEQGYPIDAYWIDSWFWDWKGRGPDGYIDFEGDREAFPNPKAMWRELEKHNVKAGIWIWHKILEDGQEELFAEFRDKGYLKEIKDPDPNGWHNRPQVTAGGSFDFENPGCVALFREKIKPQFDDGLDFFKLDGTSWIPAMKAIFECTQDLGHETRGRGFIMTHKFGVDDPRYKRYPVKWSSDTKAAWTTPHWPNYENEWSHGGFRENVEMVANPRLYTSTIPFLTHDGQGFKEFDSPDMDDEYYSRYTQFGCFCPVFEVFSSMTNPRHNFPFHMGETAQTIFRRYTHWRMRLFPYIYTHAHLIRQTGQNMVQGDGVHLTQYRLGDAFLVAPVVERWARTRDVWLPKNDLWINYWTNEKFTGGQTVTVAAPVEQMPLFIRGGSIIPKRDYARSIERGSNDKLTLDIYPHNESTFTLYEDDGTSNDYLTGGFSTTRYLCREAEDAFTFEIQPIQGQFDGMPQNRYYVLRFHIDKAPIRMIVNGRKVNVIFDDDEKMLTALVAHKTDERVDIEMHFRL